MRKILIALATSALLAGCSMAGAAGAGAPSVTITGPANNADVAGTFSLEFTTSEEIGPPESGKHHVHVFTDGKTDDYTVVTASPFEIAGLPAGEHTVGVTLQNADHSPAGASAEITVNVTEGQPSQPTQNPGDGY
ncbi:Ig-like domain-containing protein [Nonomuraea sp. 3N208]|uniref:Ig-like domain-containing protein n=1 Tax=Nonomuraea sp. 3N208 TaxID=3457421 RepID=UPI003FCCB8E6